jgi:hypothetical protein
VVWLRRAPQGIALRIEANIEKGSKFELFRPVTYREKRPTIYRDAVQFLTSSLFDDQDASKLAMMDDIIYTKTLKWQYESEYRLAIPRDQGEPDWEALKFHPEEITELYLGLAIVNKDNVVAMAKALNPKIAVFETRWSNDAKLIFDRAE